MKEEGEVCDDYMKDQMQRMVLITLATRLIFPESEKSRMKNIEPSLPFASSPVLSLCGGKFVGSSPGKRLKLFAKASF